MPTPIQLVIQDLSVVLVSTVVYPLNESETHCHQLVSRTNPAFTDIGNTHLLPPPPGTSIQDSDLMCKPTQSQGNQTDGPSLVVTSGSRIALRYLENGHITQPRECPQEIGPDQVVACKPNSGQVFVYATTNPLQEENFLAIHEQWTPNGLGGDQRGFLLAVAPFDDSRCFQFDPTGQSEISHNRNLEFGPGTTVTEAPNRWCQIIVTLTDQNGVAFTPDTVLTLYWVWDWPSTVIRYPEAVSTTLNETYTSCMDIRIV